MNAAVLIKQMPKRTWVEYLYPLPTSFDHCDFFLIARLSFLTNNKELFYRRDKQEAQWNVANVLVNILSLKSIQSQSLELSGVKAKKFKTLFILFSQFKDQQIG